MGTIDENRRHWLVAIYLQLAIRIYYFFWSWGGIRPLVTPITDYQSQFRPKNAPKYDFLTRLGFVWLWFGVAVSREFVVPYFIFLKTGLIHLIVGIHNWLCSRVEKSMKNKKVDREVPIPEYDWKNGTPEDFHKLFVERPHPIILRGFMKDQELLKGLAWDSILERFGEEDVFLTKRDKDGYPGKLKEVNNPGVYLHNSEKLFNKYPDLRQLFQYERLEPFLKMKVGYEQIFVGRKGTGSPFHHASVYNMFYQVDGKKTWYFIDPSDTFLGYPVAILGRAAGFLMCLWPNEYNKDAFPLFQYCPIFTATLEPGDVLFNPPWWWHSIKNVTETTVGVASRWHTDGIIGDKLVTTEEDYGIYKVGSFFHFAGFRSWQFLHSILLTPSPKYDEHVTLREMNNRYVHFQTKISDEGGVNILGHVSKF